MYADHLSRTQAWQVMHFLLLTAKLQNRQLKAPHLRIDAEQKTVILAAIAQSLHGNHHRQRIGRTAPVLLGNGQALNAEFGTLDETVAVELTVVIERDHIADQFVSGKFQYRFLI